MTLEKINFSDIKLVLFDMDGTLLRLDINYKKMRAEVKRVFVSAGVPDSWVFKPILEKISNGLNYLSKIGHSKEEIEKIRSAALKKIVDMEIEGAKRAVAIVGVKELLSILREKKLIIGIFSRTGKEAVKAALETCQFGKFDIIIAREDVKKTKPHPEAIFLAKKRMGIPNKKIILIGDHPYDIEAGKRANIKTIGVLTGVADKMTLEKAGANLIVENVGELKNFM